MTASIWTRDEAASAALLALADTADRAAVAVKRAQDKLVGQKRRTHPRETP